MLHAQPVTPASPLMAEITPLYQRAFPANERGPLHFFMQESGWHCDMLAFLQEDTFCGFALLLTIRDITHILYFAMQETQRSKGYGTAALQIICERYPQNRIIADIEKEVPTAANNAQRQRRRSFYLKNGFAVSPVSYTWRGESYDIVVHGGELAEAEFDAFWQCAEETAKAAEKSKATENV